MTYNIFISYSTKDGEIARQMQNYLAQIQGSSVFLSVTSLIVGPLSDALLKKIQQCDLFLVLYSRNSAHSPYVNQEIGSARTHGKIIVPILLDQDAKPDAMLQGLSYLTLYDPAKSNEQMPHLYNYVVREAQKKEGTQALLALGALFLFGYMLSKE